MSRAASGLHRALIARAGCDAHRILLTDVRSTDWQSLTFSGERHVLTLRITGKDRGKVANSLCTGLADADFVIPGHIVADIVTGPVTDDKTESVLVTIDALTISE